MDNNDIPSKRCTKCGEEKPATKEFFNSQPGGKYGLKAECKTCYNKRNKLYQNRPEVRESLQNYRKDYYGQVREQRREKVKIYNQSPRGREMGRARAKTYYAGHKEQRKTYYKTYHSQHKEQLKGYYVRHYTQHKEQQIIKGQRRRARKLAVSGTHTASQIQEMLKRQRHKCYYCSTGFQRVKGKYVYHIDHTFPLSRVAGSDIPANDINYLVLTCPACNLSKGDKFPWEFPEGGKLL